MLLHHVTKGTDIAVVAQDPKIRVETVMKLDK
jgi:hypothetical protein